MYIRASYFDFNSIKVRLKQRVQRGYRAVEVDFNSIKVRLKREKPTFQEPPTSFQFHKGTIKTYQCGAV